MGDIIKTVLINAPDIVGYPGPDHYCNALLDTTAPVTTITEQLAEQLGVDSFIKKINIGGKPHRKAKLYIKLEEQDCTEQYIYVLISDKIKRKIGSKAEMILGHDYLQKAYGVIAYTKKPGHNVYCLSYDKKRKRS